MDFYGKTVLITGGTSGIGLSIAKSFEACGAEVVAAGLASDEAIASGVQRESLEVTDAASVTRLLSTISRLDVLVNAAGIIRRDAEFELERFTEVIDVNLTGTMRVTMAAKPKLIETRGCVVNFASMYSTFGAPRAPAYEASKAGVVQLTRSLAVA